MEEDLNTFADWSEGTRAEGGASDARRKEPREGDLEQERMDGVWDPHWLQSVGRHEACGQLFFRQIAIYNNNNNNNNKLT